MANGSNARTSLAPEYAAALAIILEGLARLVDLDGTDPRHLTDDQFDMIVGPEQSLDAAFGVDRRVTLGNLARDVSRALRGQGGPAAGDRSDTNV